MKKAIKYFFLWLGWMIPGALLMMFPALIIAFAVTGGHPDNFIQNHWFMSLVMMGSQLLPIYIFWRAKYANFGIDSRINNVKLYLWIALATIGCLIINGILQYYLPFAEMEIEDLQFLEELGKNPIGIISVCILAPLGEEAVFRGAIERHFLDKNWKPWLAILVSAIFFAVAHFNFTQGLTAIIIGILLGWVYSRTRNLWPCIFIHAVNNTTATVLGFIYEDAAETTTTSLPVDIAWLAGATALGCFAIWQFNKVTKSHMQVVLAEQQARAEQQALAEEQAFYELNNLSDSRPVPPPFPSVNQQNEDTPTDS